MLFDSKLTFQSQTDNICIKKSQKLNAISRMTPYMDFNKNGSTVSSILMIKFSYCQLIWMSHDRTYNNKKYRLHERYPRLTYIDKHSSFENLLEKDTGY